MTIAFAIRINEVRELCLARFVLLAMGAMCAQRTILHEDKTPVTQAGSRLRAEPAPEGHGLDAAGVEGSLTSMQSGSRHKRRQ